MHKRSWFFVLPLIAGLLFLGVGASQAGVVSPLWKITAVTATGCSSGDYGFTVDVSGVPGAGYLMHTVATAGGKVYMNEDAGDANNGTQSWHLFNDSSYGPITGTMPIPDNEQLTVTMTLEHPKGTVVSSWTFVTSSCTDATPIFNGLTSQDKCPTITVATKDGCPLRTRSLSLAAQNHRMRLTGRLKAAGEPKLADHRKIVIWKIRHGKAHWAASTMTNGKGMFSIKLHKGRYYATSPGVIVPTEGQALAVRSRTVRLR